MHRPGSRHYVADVPGFDFRQQGFGETLFSGIHLYAPAHILNHQERPALGHDTASDARLPVQLGQFFLVLVSQLGLQIRRQAVTPELIGKSRALLTLEFELLATLGYQLVFVLLLVVHLVSQPM